MTLLLCALLPIIAAVIIAFVPEQPGRRGRAAIALVTQTLTFGAALAIAQALGAGRPTLVAEIGPWLPIRGGDVTLHIESATLPLLLVATAVPAIIAIVSWRAPKTMADHAALLLGTSASVVLITAASLVLAAGALGVMSAATYLMFSSGRERAAVAAAGERAFVIDRIGDAAMVLASIAYLALFRSVDVIDIAARLASAQPDAALIVPSILLTTSVLAKSGLVPFQMKAATLRAAPAPLGAFGGSVALGTGIIVLIRLHSFIHPTVLAAAAALGALSAVVVLVVAVTRSDGRDALAWSAAAPAGIAVAAVGAGATNAAVAMFSATGVAATVLVLIAALDRAGLAWRGVGAPRLRRAVVDGLGFVALATAIGRAYGGMSRTLERGTDVTLDALFLRLATLTASASRALAREERRAVRVEAVAIAGLIGLVAFWIAR